MRDDCDGELRVSIDSFQELANGARAGGGSAAELEAGDGALAALVHAAANLAVLDDGDDDDGDGDDVYADDGGDDGGDDDDDVDGVADADAVDDDDASMIAAEDVRDGGDAQLNAGDQAGVPAVSRKYASRLRSRRDRPRSKTIAMKRLTRAELQRGAALYPPVDNVERPQTRSECRDAPRPCPWVACKHHLYLDINPRTGSIKINFPDLEPWELEHTCALDVAENGGLTLEEIGLITNLTRERVRQVEVRGLLTLRARANALR